MLEANKLRGNIENIKNYIDFHSSKLAGLTSCCLWLTLPVQSRKVLEETYHSNFLSDGWPLS
jgi:hypothetical protein